MAPAADRARRRRRLGGDPGDPRSGGRRVPPEVRRASLLRRAWQRRIGADRAATRSRARSPARICCWRSAACRTPTISGLDRAGVADRRARLHRGRRRAANQRPGYLGARRRQRTRRVHAHVVQRLRDRRREPARRRAAPRQRSHPGLRAVHRSAARPRRHDRARGARFRTARADGNADDGAGRPRARTQRDAGLHAGAGRRGDEENPRGGACSASKATRRCTASST